MSDIRSLAANGSASTEVALRVAPPTRHQLAIMIWVAVFPTLTVLNLALAPWLATLGTVLRTLVLATLAVPIVMYGLMPQLHRLRARIVGHRQPHGATGLEARISRCRARQARQRR